MTTTTDASTLEHRIGPAGRLQIRMMSGSIAIRAVEGETVRVRERNGRSLADAFRVETGADRLSLTSNEKFGGVDFIVFSIGRRSALALEVDVPRGTAVGVDFGKCRDLARRAHRIDEGPDRLGRHPTR